MGRAVGRQRRQCGLGLRQSTVTSRRESGTGERTAASCSGCVNVEGPRRRSSSASTWKILSSNEAMLLRCSSTNRRRISAYEELTHMSQITSLHKPPCSEPSRWGRPMASSCRCRIIPRPDRRAPALRARADSDQGEAGRTNSMRTAKNSKSISPILIRKAPVRPMPEQPRDIDEDVYGCCRDCLNVAGARRADNASIGDEADITATGSG